MGSIFKKYKRLQQFGHFHYFRYFRNHVVQCTRLIASYGRFSLC